MKRRLAVIAQRENMDNSDAVLLDVLFISEASRKAHPPETAQKVTPNKNHSATTDQMGQQTANCVGKTVRKKELPEKRKKLPESQYGGFHTSYQAYLANVMVVISYYK